MEIVKAFRGLEINVPIGEEPEQKPGQRGDWDI
jgi:hypothetical protein